MIIKIHDTDSIQSLRERFHHHYRYLQLVFFSKAHQSEEGSFNKHRYPVSLALGEIRKIHGCDEIEIRGKDRTTDVEQAFEKLFGFHVQVYRKSGPEWVQTIGTDHMTIEEQNALGRRSDLISMHPDMQLRIEDHEY